MSVAEQPSGTLADRVLKMKPEKRAAWMLSLPDEELDFVEQAIAERVAIGWRATPATFANYLTVGKYQLWRYVRLLGEQFRDAANGVNPHQIWELPSQYGKTSALTWGIVWLLDRDPTTRIMYVSYDDARAVEVGSAARDIAEGRHPDVPSELAARLRFKLRSDSRAKGAWKTEEGGGLYCVSVGGGITGFPQDVVLGDDLIKGWQAAHSAADRERVWNVLRSQMRMRLQSSTDPMIIAGTRWHEDDIAGRLMASQDDPGADQWHVVRLPATAEAPNPDSSDPILRAPDPLNRAPGEILEPERFDQAEVDSRRLMLGSYLWAALEQARPAPEEGGEIKRAWFKTDEVMPVAADEWLSSWDFKMKDKETGDFVVGQIWARTGKDCWLVDQFRGQWNFATTVNAVALAVVRHPQCRRHVMENAGNGPEVIEALRTAAPGYEVSDEIGGLLGMTAAELAEVNRVRRRGVGGIVPNNAVGSKPTRMRAVSPFIEAGDTHLPQRAQWLGAYLDEMAAFPHGAHDDQVDATSQALAKLHRRSSGRKPTGDLQRAVAAQV